MNNSEIKIIQNILKQQNMYDLAIKLENSYFKTEYISTWNEVESVCLEIYVHPHYFLELNRLDEETLESIQLLFSGLMESSIHIQNIEFKIDKDVKIHSISDTVYIL